ncbi:MAG: Fic family protein [Eggerthellaceae bacterium]|nr:Fic family protein [Eggerthellaceae bacterium]
MRTFDYRHLPQGLFDGKVGTANVRLYEDRGKFNAVRESNAGALEALRREARFDNVNSSMRIEGFYTPADRVREIVEGAQPASDAESQIAGYARALALVEGGAQRDGECAVGENCDGDASRLACEQGASGETLSLSTATVLKLYETLYGHRNLGRKSRYRKKDYIYVQVDGHPQAMPASPITAFETPLVLGGACDGLADAFLASSCSPLILSAVFTVDFLAIRPFDEGNGRIARLFANLLLEKAGFDVFRYMSVDRIIEESGMAYYDALNACVEGWDVGRNDYAPYVLYWLNVVHEAYERLFRALEVSGGSGAGKSERVKLFVRGAGAPVAKRDVRAALPDVSEATVEAELGRMVKDGLVEKLGAGRATTYRWVK